MARGEGMLDGTQGVRGRVDALAAALCDGQRKYVGIEIDPTLSAKAAARVAADGNAEVRTADFFVDELPAGVDTAILSSNVLFSTPRHAELLEWEPPLCGRQPLL